MTPQNFTLAYRFASNDVEECSENNRQKTKSFIPQKMFIRNKKLNICKNTKRISLNTFIPLSTF